MSQYTIRVALQRSGRLAEGSQWLLSQCGINAIPAKNQLWIQDPDFGLEFIFARDDDIPGLVEKGVCDLGIIGSNLMEEYCGNENNLCQQIEKVMPLGFARCRLSMAAPKESVLSKITDLTGKIIATSYPTLVRRFLDKHNIEATIITMHGSIELAPKMEIADVICDLVSSGATLRENGLVEWMTVMESEAVLISNRSSINKEKKELLERLLLRINGIIKADKNKYVMLHIEREKVPLLSTLLPGSEAPTVIDLQGVPGKVAVHVVTHETLFWDTIETLKAIGACSILVLPIEKMIE